MTTIIDSHCDTIISVVDKKTDIFSEAADLHITLPGLRKNRVALQVFACFTTVLEHGDDCPGRSRTLLSRVLQLAERPGFSRPRTLRELHNCIGSEDVAVLPAIEGGEALGGRLEAVAEMKQHGVVYITLAWHDNELTGSSFGENRGLSALGRDVVREMNSQMILVDVSHMSDAAFSDLVKLSGEMLIASHSNCRALCSSPRNLTDDQIREIAARGGVIGVNFAAAFLSEETHQHQLPYVREFFTVFESDPKSAQTLYEEMNEKMAREAPQPDSEAIVDHIEHISSLVGVEHVALGSDFDGYSFGVSDFNNCDGYQIIIEKMRGRGFSEDQIDAVAWKNWLRVFSTTFA